ncbi:hypothetical protein K2Q00_02870 [Patescibacteria group bacterium]|nr:hypothetical protein [Patescibacteria group bacterium]
MQFNLSYRNNIFILGAGASKDYDLPTWNELDSLMRGRLKSEAGNQYPRAKDVLAWLDKVGENKEKEYKTIDECIEKESVSEAYHTDGDSVENELFAVMKDIFNDVYKENKLGWITLLNDKIVENSRIKLEDSFAFVSYNYDNVLEKNFLRFAHLPGKRQRLNSRSRLGQLLQTIVPVLYAHGSLYEKDEIPNDSHTKRHYRTMKSGVGGYIDAVSCYESDPHTVTHDAYADKLNLFILGLGGGLKYNLSKLDFSKTVNQIFVTVSESRNPAETVEFLSDRFKISKEKIYVFKTCAELVEECF